MIEHRLGSDPGSDPRLVRLSVGVEELEVCIVLAIYIVQTRVTDPCDLTCRI